MAIYFIAFILSILLAVLTKYIVDKRLVLLINVIAILPPAIVAGVRDLSIGTDISNYGWFNFDAATHFSNLFDYIEYIRLNNKVEMGYSVLNFVVSRFTSSVNVFLFVLNFLTLLFVVLALYQLRNKIPIYYGLIIYYLTAWGTSLNVMRQSLAAAIVLFAICMYVKNNKIIPFFLFTLIAISIHQTAIIAVAVFIIYVLSSDNIKMIHIVAIAILGFVLYIVLNPNNGYIITIMRNIPILGKYYAIFTQHGLGYISSGGGMSIKSILIQVLPALLALLALIRYKTKQVTDDGKIIVFSIIMLILTIIFELININSGVLARLGMYFSVMQVITISFAIYKNKNERLLWGSLIFIAALFAFIVTLKSGSGEIYPYTSQLLNEIL